MATKYAAAREVLKRMAAGDLPGIWELGVIRFQDGVRVRGATMTGLLRAGRVLAPPGSTVLGRTYTLPADNGLGVRKVSQGLYEVVTRLGTYLVQQRGVTASGKGAGPWEITRPGADHPFSNVCLAKSEALEVIRKEVRGAA